MVPLEILGDPAPAFICKGFDSSRKLVVPLVHVAGEPASQRNDDRIPNVPGADVARQFYAAHDGLRLFKGRCDLVSEGSGGLVIYPITEWDRAAARLKKDWSDWRPYLSESESAYTPADVIPIALMIGASNPVHWVVRGARAGSVFSWPWTMPPCPSDPPLTESFEAFVNAVIREPGAVDEMLGGYLVYTDGRTDDQWHPFSYVADRSQLRTDADGLLIE